MDLARIWRKGSAGRGEDKYIGPGQKCASFSGSLMATVSVDRLSKGKCSSNGRRQDQGGYGI